MQFLFESFKIHFKEKNSFSSFSSGQDLAGRREGRYGDGDQRWRDHPEGHRSRQPRCQSSGWWVKHPNICWSNRLQRNDRNYPSRRCHFKILFVFLDMSKVQDDEVGDGTTSVTVLAAELLRVNNLLLYYKMCSSLHKNTDQFFETGVYCLGHVWFLSCIHALFTLWELHFMNEYSTTISALYSTWLRKGKYKHLA